MSQKIKSAVKIVLGLFIVIVGFPAVVSSLFIVIGGVLAGSPDPYTFGRAVGRFFGILVVWIIGLWLLISWYKQRKLARQGIPDNTKNASNR